MCAVGPRPRAALSKGIAYAYHMGVRERPDGGPAYSCSCGRERRVGIIDFGANFVSDRCMTQHVRACSCSCHFYTSRGEDKSACYLIEYQLKLQFRMLYSGSRLPVFTSYFSFSDITIHLTYTSLLFPIGLVFLPHSSVGDAFLNGRG
jgi:hypothetical protein